MTTKKSISEFIESFKNQPHVLFQERFTKFGTKKLINYNFIGFESENKTDCKKDFYTTKGMLKITTDCYIPTLSPHVTSS